VRFCSFDLEIAKELQPGDWQAQRPLGITCAATVCSGDAEPRVWFGECEAGYAANMCSGECRDLVRCLMQQAESGFVPLTWNGLSFDFDILAEESGMWRECADLAMHHVDIMFQVVCTMGYPVGLNACLTSMGLPGKQGMTGADAPRIWKTEPEAVLEYVKGDVTGPLLLAEEVTTVKCIHWLSKRGNPMLCPIDQWLTIEECLALPLPDTSWMTDPKPREHYYKWIGEADKRAAVDACQDESGRLAHEYRQEVRQHEEMRDTIYGPGRRNRR